MLLRLKIIVAFFFLALLVSGPNVAADKAALKVSLLPFLSYAPLFIAVEEGFFEEQDIEIEFVSMRGAGAATTQLALGAIDVSTDSTGANLFNAIAKGLNVKIVADKSQINTESRYAGWMVRKELYDSGEVRKIEQLEGRKVAIEHPSVWGYVYDTLLRSGGLTLDDIEIVTIPTASKFEALRSGAIDVASTAEPIMTRMETEGFAVRLTGYAEHVNGYQSSSIVYGPNLLENDRDLGRRFMVAYLKGVKQFREGKTDRNLEIISKHTNLDIELLEKVSFPYFSPDGHVNVESLLAAQDWLFENNYVDKKMSTDQMIDRSFVDYATEMLD